MKVGELLWDHVREHDLCPGSPTLEAWRRVRWIRVRIGGRAVPILPVVGYRDTLHLHDVHHVLTGAATDLRSEIELAAWEVASGGCGWSLPFWVDRVGAVLLGLVLCPRRVVRGMRRGAGVRNVYGRRVDDVLEREVDDLRAELRLT